MMQIAENFCAVVEKGHVAATSLKKIVEKS